MSTSNGSKYAVPALDKGMDILEFMATNATPLSQTEIAQGIERSPNEIYRVLVGLESRGYLVRDDISGKYSMSLKLYTLSRKISPVAQLRQTAIPIMDDFAAQSGHAAHLSILYQSKVMVVVQTRSHSPISLSIAEGTLFPSVMTTSGRVLLANSSEAVKSLIYERDEHYETMNKSEKEKLEDDLSNILERGYCYRNSTLTEGVTDCACIIGQAENALIASLTVSSLSSTLGDNDSKEDLIQMVMATAKQITLRLGC